MKWRGSWIAIVVLACGMSVGTIRGDGGPPTIFKFPIMRFDNLADYPDFSFYLKYCCGRGNPYGSPHLIPIQSGEAFRPEGGHRRTAVFLLAVPRGQQPSFGKNDPSWLHQTPADCLQSADLEGTYAGIGYLVPYRVQIQDGKMQVAMQPNELLAGEWTVSWLERLPYILVPVAFCAAFGWLGARMARRLFPSKPAR